MSDQAGLREEIVRPLQQLYQQDLDGRTVLDPACNGGAYLFWAGDAGAGDCFGSDVREDSIRQARLLQEGRAHSKGIRFEAMEIYDLPELGLEPFDVTIFAGLFCHLADPVSGLKIAADLTNDLMVIDTATMWGTEDDSLVAGAEGLKWVPSGPAVVERILRWAGFIDTQVMHRVQTGETTGQVVILATKRPGLLDVFR